MKLKVFILFLLVIFQGCSLKTPANKWEYNSSIAFSSYTKYFLEDNLTLAKSEFQRAVKYAKQSANLNQLGRIYLGSCALNISVEQNTNCNKYNQIEEFISSKELIAYHKMLENNLTFEEIKNLPKQYQDFAKYKLLNKKDLIFNSIKQMEQITSKFIASSLVKNDLKKEDIKYLIERASFYGYKKLVLYWLKYLLKIENDIKEKQKIINKIKILTLPLMKN